MCSPGRRSHFRSRAICPIGTQNALALRYKHVSQTGMELKRRPERGPEPVVLLLPVLVSPPVLFGGALEVNAPEEP